MNLLVALLLLGCGVAGLVLFVATKQLRVRFHAKHLGIADECDHWSWFLGAFLMIGGFTVGAVFLLLART